MTFEIAETETKDNMPPTACLTYMRTKRKGGGAFDRDKVKPRLSVTLPTVVCIAKSERFLLLLGTDADAGKIRIRGTKEKKGIKPSEFKKHLILRFGHVPKLGDAIFDGMRCPVRRVSDEEYEIDAPFLKEEA